MRGNRPRVAVVGHVEWVRFACVSRMPRAGEIVHARDPFEEPAGGGAVAAVQLARLAGACVLVSALGDDEHGRRSVERLRELGVDLRAAWRAGPTRTATTLVDDAGERTIVTYGPRLEPLGSDAELPWSELAEMDAVYFTAGDVGALHAARAARVLVASPRATDALGHGVALDALVSSAKDAIERDEVARAREEAELIVATEGAHGGVYRERGGGSGSWTAAPPPGAAVDSYGSGDSFAAGLTYALGAGMAAPQALDLAARCGAVCLTGRGPYERQLTAQELESAASVDA
ncbi:MAG TPA: PfkB family carbohydrate kinase [Solirubrobacteraceae bacterium]|jgi:ribokinase|nr:PfkB family carbohydrate kinase [Solirubrobacteraceae bacterium]